MRGILRWGLGMVALAMLAGCQEASTDGNHPFEARLQLAVGHGAGASAVEVSVSYQRKVGGNQTLMTRKLSVAGNQAAVPLEVDLEPCLTDPDRVGTGQTCMLDIALALLDAADHVLDRKVVTSLAVSPGASVSTGPVTLQSPPLSIVTESLPPGVENRPLPQPVLQAVGGLPPYRWRWEAAAGALPPGLALDSTTGAVSGVAGQPGSYPVKVTAHDAAMPAQSATKTYDIVVQPARPFRVWIAAQPVGAVSGQHLLTQPVVELHDDQDRLVASATDTVVATLTGGGTLSGTVKMPAVAGMARFNDLSVTGGGAYVLEFTSGMLAPATSDTFEITPVLQITTTGLPSGLQNRPYPQTILQATGGLPPYRWRWQAASGALPLGLTLDSIAGSVSGVPSQVGSYSVQVTARDGATIPQTATQTYVIRVLIVSPSRLAITIQPAGAVSGQLLSLQPTVEIHDALDQLVTSATDTIVAALLGSGTLSGTTRRPAVGGVAQFNDLSVAGGGAYTLEFSSGTLQPARSDTFSIIPVLGIVTPSPLPVGVVGTAYTQPLAATGGTGTYGWRVAQGSSAPPGLALSSIGNLGGTPTLAGNFSFTVEVSSGTQTVRSSFNLGIVPALVINGTPLPPATQGQPYSASLTATGGTGAYTWSLVQGGSTPPGLSLSLNGLVSGTPTLSGSYIVPVEVTSGTQRVGRSFQLIVAVPAPAITPSSIITTVAGTGANNWAGDLGPAVSADLAFPADIVFAPDGSYLVSTIGDGRIRRVDPLGTISTIAGTGSLAYGGDNGPATSASFHWQHAQAVAPDGSVYIADYANCRVRRIDSAGIVTTIAGLGTAAFSGDGGPATVAEVCANALARASNGTLYLTEYSPPTTNRVRRVDPNGIISTFAGTGSAGSTGDGGPATAAQLNRPQMVTVGPDGSVYIAEEAGYRIRRILPNGIITAYAGTGVSGFGGDNGPATSAQISGAYPMVFGPDGAMYFGDNGRIRRIDLNGIISTVAGTGVQSFGGDNGPAGQAQFNTISGLAFAPDGALLVGDQANHRVRRIK